MLFLYTDVDPVVLRYLYLLVTKAIQRDMYREIKDSFAIYMRLQSETPNIYIMQVTLHRSPIELGLRT